MGLRLGILEQKPTTSVEINGANFPLTNPIILLGFDKTAETAETAETSGTSETAVAKTMSTKAIRELENLDEFTLYMPATEVLKRLGYAVNWATARNVVEILSGISAKIEITPPPPELPPSVKLEINGAETPVKSQVLMLEPFQAGERVLYLPAEEVLERLGYAAKWDSGRDVLEVLGEIRKSDYTVSQKPKIGETPTTSYKHEIVEMPVKFTTLITEQKVSELSDLFNRRISENWELAAHTYMGDQSTATNVMFLTFRAADKTDKTVQYKSCVIEMSTKWTTIISDKEISEFEKLLGEQAAEGWNLAAHTFLSAGGGQSNVLFVTFRKGKKYA